MKRNTIIVLALLTIISQLVFAGGSALLTVNAEEVNPDSPIVETAAEEVEETPAEPVPEATIEPVQETVPEATLEATEVEVSEPIIESEPEVTSEPEPIVEPEPEVAPEPVATEEVATEPVVEETAPAPELTTDKPDYQPGETVSIFGRFFQAVKNIVLKIFGGSQEEENYTETSQDVTTDEQGSFVTTYIIDNIFRPIYTVIANALTGEELTRTTFTDTAPADIDQCANGGVGSTPTSPCDWVNGNVNSAKAHYVEGQSVPYHMIMTGLTTGVSHTLVIGFDVKQSSKFAIDYITSNDRIAETVNPCIDSHGNMVSPCEAGTPMPIPEPAYTGSVGTITPSTVAGSFHVLLASEKLMKIYNGSITSVTYTQQANISNAASEARVTIVFIPTNATAIVSWGGHISKNSDYPGLSAISLSGSPYHTRLIDLDGSGGNCDKQLAAAAVTAPSTITIHKVTSPNASDLTIFSFTAGGTGYSNFILTGGNQKLQNVSPGSYTVTETIPSGWGNTSLTCNASGTGTNVTPNLASHSVAITIGSGGGGIVDCTYTNTLQQAHLTLVKTVTKDNGGTAAATDWTLSASGPTPISGVTGNAAVTNAAVNSGTYTLSESGGPSGYTASTYSCVNNGGTPVVSNSIILAAGDTATCTINNNDIAPQLIIIKHVIKDNGGTATAGNWTIDVTATNPSSNHFAGQESPGVTITLNAGSYSVDESGGPSGYSKSLSADCSGTITIGQTKTCTITNDDQQAYIIVDKTVINNNGGSAVANDFLLTVDGNAALDGVAVPVNPGAHTAGETPLSGYTAGAWGGDCNVNASVTVVLGETKTCTITNDDIQPKLHVIKHVINDNGGNAVAGNFTMNVTGSSPSPASFSGAEDPGTLVMLNAGAYSVDENAFSGYAKSLGANCSGNISVGEEKTCTITNDDIAPTITLIKTVNNDHGGNNVPADFTLKIDNQGVAQNTAIPVTANTAHTINETLISGYQFVSIAGTGCPTQLGGTVNLNEGENITCTITNEDIPAHVTLTKVVNNNHGGNAGVNDFGLTIGGTSVTSGQALDVNSNTPIALNEAGLTGYNFVSIAGDAKCPQVLGGTVALNENESVSCTIINEDIAPTITLIKHVDNDHGGDAVPADFTLKIDNQGVAQNTAIPVTSNATHSIDETLISGYQFISITGDTKCPSVLQGTVTLDEGENITCTITNEDKPAKITLIKEVINDNGGTAGVNEFGLTTGGTSVNSGQTLEVNSNTSITINEAGHTGYQFVSITGDNCPQSLGGTVTLNEGQEITCTITNNDIQPKLTVTKIVVNDNGGNKVIADFPLFVNTTGVTSGVQNGFNADSYTVSETGQTGYAAAITGDCASNGSITLAVGDVKSCIITNDDIAPKLTLVKTVTNDNGGTKVVAGFPLFINGNPVTSGVANTLMANTLYTATETSQTGYAPSAWGGNCTENGTITLLPGDDKTCTITNDDIQPKLTLIKHVVNDNGGTLAVANFPLFVSGNLVTSGVANGFNAGSYSATETTQYGYAASVWSGACAADGSVTLSVGDDKTCEITNDDIQPKLKLVKTMNNLYGGTATAADFQGSVSGTDVDWDTFVGFNAGNYDANETGLYGYAASDWTGDCAVDGAVTLAVGNEKTCYITNSDIQPKLHVIKHVINDNGGALEADDFDITVTGTNANPSAFDGVESPGTLVMLNAGAYSIDEAAVYGYAKTLGTDCSGSVAVGDEKTCTITNDDIQPKLTVTKIVVNDNGGNKVIADFPLFVGATSVTSGAQNGFNANTYTVSETRKTGYAETISGDCDPTTGSVTLAVGDVKTCTITNDDIAPKLTLVKTVVNDNGGTAVVADFPLFINGNPVTSGVANTLSANVLYTSTETAKTGYAPSAWGTNCAANGTITLQPGDDKTCTITNDDIRPKLHVIKHVINDNGGTKNAADFSITVTGSSPSPASFNGDENGTLVAIDAGSYSVTEIPVFGYADSYSADCTGSVFVGDEKTCNITNSDIQPKLKLIKTMDIKYGGTATAADFQGSVSGTDVDWNTFIGFNAGNYDANETGLYGYTASDWTGDCATDGAVTLAVGDEKTCNITNSDIQPKLTINKVVNNNYGGTLTDQDFPLFVDQTSVSEGVQTGFNAGTYTVSETQQYGYSLVSIVCDGQVNDQITLAVGDEKECTITNEDIPATLTIVKDAVPNDCKDFNFITSWNGPFTLDDDEDATECIIDPTNQPKSKTFIDLSAGNYTVSETVPNFWELGSITCVNKDTGGSFPVTVNGNGMTVSLGLAQNVECTFTNNKLGPSRTQGFWKTHTQFTTDIFNQYFLPFGGMAIGDPLTTHQEIIDTPAKLFGAWYSDVNFTTQIVGKKQVKRTQEDKTRILLAHQLITAKLNCVAFGGCGLPVASLITQADAAYASGNIGQMNYYMGQLDNFNNSGDTIIISPPLPWQGKATPKTSESVANKVFWDIP